MVYICISEKTHENLCSLFDIEFQSIKFEPIEVEGFPICGNLHPMFGLTHSESTRKKLSESTKRMMLLPGMKERNSELQKISQSKTDVIEKKKKSNEWRSVAIYAWHEELTKNQEILYRSVRDFCQKTGANRSVVYGILSGKYKQSFGWRCKYAT
jgi:hypothetical protein